ncbi:MAG: 3-deoxy-manno-octulosonate cytidylyltransferase [Casimicrobium sp.]
MSFIVVIPARYASTRFPGKPLIDLNGKPMVVRVAERARQSSAKQVLVATDDPRIAAACDDWGVAYGMTRSDHATGTDRLSEVAKSLNLPDDAVVVNVQGDEPLIPANVIDQVAAMLDAKPNAAMATLCHPIHDLADVINPNVVKCVINELGEALYFSRAPIPFARDAWRGAVDSIPDGLPMLRHIGLYAYRAGFLRCFPALSIPAIERHEALEQLRALAHGFRIAVAVVPDALPPGIDTPQDYERLKTAYSGIGDTFWM